MLTPKRNGSGKDFFSAGSRHRTVGAGKRKPLSEILREERERQKMSLQAVAELTDLPLAYLQLLEGAGDERLVPDPLYLRWPLRSYAAFLNLDLGAALPQCLAELIELPPGEVKAGGGTRPPPGRPHGAQLRSWVLPGTILLLLTLGRAAMVAHYNEPAQKPRFKEAPASPRAALSDSGPAAESGTSSPASSSGLFSVRPEAMPLHLPSSPSTGSPLIAATPRA